MRRKPVRQVKNRLSLYLRGSFISFHATPHNINTHSAPDPALMRLHKLSKLLLFLPAAPRKHPSWHSLIPTTLGTDARQCWRMIQVFTSPFGWRAMFFSSSPSSLHSPPTTHPSPPTTTTATDETKEEHAPDREGTNASGFLMLFHPSARVLMHNTEEKIRFPRYRNDTSSLHDGLS